LEIIDFINVLINEF